MAHLTEYLNDHLAGSVGALELLDRLVEAYEARPLERFFQDLRDDIHSDQEQLQSLIQLGATESAARKAGAWIVEKLSRLKLDLRDGSPDEFGLLLCLETLVLGITGKRSL